MAKKTTTIYTKSCVYCNSEFKIPATLKKRKFCSMTCSRAGQGKRHGQNKNTTKCAVCEKEFSHYGTKIVCSRKCMAKYFSEKRIGVGNPFFKGKDKFIKLNCENCKNEFTFTKGGNKPNRKFCSHKCVSEFYSKDNHWGFKKEKESRIYPQEFNLDFKNKIRERDLNSCFLCGKTKKENRAVLSVHHIDYIKENLEEKNLITLCNSCHCATNYNRDFWKFLLGSILTSGCKIVKKGWGAEAHIINNEKYCLKYLIFFPGKKFSLHFHKLKHETWHCLFGEFDVILQDEQETEFSKLKTGETLVINQNLKHQLIANQYSILTEVSTTDYPEDSYRIEKGD